METNLLLKRTEIACAEQIPSLAVWVIEYAWSHRMMDVLEGLVPYKWQEGELQSLTLQEPCALRVAAAQAWSVVNARDVKHFESVLELLESIYTLVPRLVTSIKHMKIMFGLKTMIVMWMLQKNHGEVSTMTKIINFFPSRVTLYRGCDQMEEQYGERYAQKLEERLFDYLQKLEKDLPPSTCIDQVLRQERPLVDGEQLLLGVLSCSPHSVPAALKRLIFYARVTPCTSPGMSQPSVCADEEKPTPQPLSDPKDSPKQTLPPAGQYCSPRSYQRCGRDTAASLARVETAGLGVQISLESQLVLIRSQMLQPTVWVRRLTQRECHQATDVS
ncbi:hypothetical protein COCON_G00108160 [Conger conger]|uniref:TERF1-interacting nuclear factor 2 N-terminal domain-containing protein n=1 Tax=Conger conger TaxID=82655 RepID=A0A9Q1DJ26_CONCO|nr:hypothetical protein COCON_G00108160 [Conger conger]